MLSVIFSYFIKQGPGVISLTSSLMTNSLTVAAKTVSNTLIFLLHFFSTNINVFAVFQDRNFTITSANNWALMVRITSKEKCTHVCCRYSVEVPKVPKRTSLEYSHSCGEITNNIYMYMVTPLIKVFFYRQMFKKFNMVFVVFSLNEKHVVHTSAQLYQNH